MLPVVESVGAECISVLNVCEKDRDDKKKIEKSIMICFGKDIII